MGNRTAAKLYIGFYMLYLLTMTIMGKSSLGSMELIIVAWSAVYMAKVLFSSFAKPLFVRGVTLLLTLFFAYTVLALMEGRIIYNEKHGFNITGIIYFRKIALSLMPIFAFYYFSMKGYITKRFMLSYLFPFVALIILSFIKQRNSALANKEVDEATINYGYDILTILPFLVFYKYRTIRQQMLMWLMIFLILFCVKRGAIICAGLSMSIYFFFMLKHDNRRKNYKAYILLIIAVLSAYFALDWMFQSSEYFVERVDETVEGDSSGRDFIYEFFWYYFLDETTTQQFLLGGGAFETLFLYGLYAHNDWLEIAINQGVLGLSIYVFFWLTFLQLCLKCKSDILVKTALWMLFVIFLLKSMFSMSYDQFTLYSNIVLGYCMAYNTDINKNNKHAKRLSTSIRQWRKRD